MLNEKQIKEAEDHIRNDIDNGMLRKLDFIDKNTLQTYKNNSEESLEVANHLFKNNISSLWVIVCSYYAMFYIANAVLYELKYKVGEQNPHRITNDALIVFIRHKLRKSLLESYDEIKNEAMELAGMKADELIKTFEFEKQKRSKFQYEMNEIIKRSKAETSLNRAKEFIIEMKKMLLHNL